MLSALLLLMQSSMIACTIVTWNIKDLGGSKNDEEIQYIARTIKKYDVIAIQEVVAKDPKGVQAVLRIVSELNRMGSKWDYKYSDATNSPSPYISERYAFIWKTSVVSIANKPFLDAHLEDKCFREPYIARFKLKQNNKYFFVVNFHSRKHMDKPEDEIIYLDDYEK